MQATATGVERQGKPLVRPPDLLTVVRIPLAVAFLWVGDAYVRLAILAAVAATDVADGFWARRIGGSRIGAALDPLVDKLFMAAAFYVVLRSGRLAVLEIVGVLLRDIVAAVSFLVAVLVRKPTTLPARAGGKAVTVCQALTLAAFLMESDLLRHLAWATAGISIYAIADYVNVGWLRSGDRES